MPAKEGKKNIKKLLQNTTLEVCEKENKNENKERDREGKQVNANRKQELALINRKVLTDSDKCATFHDFSLGIFEDSLYFRALNVGQTVLQHKLCYASTIICDVVKLCPSCQYS